MGKVDVYLGGYLTIDDVTKAESECLASNEAMVGNPLVISYDAETSTFKAALPSGKTVGTVRPKNRLALREAFEEDWTRRAWLSLVYYDNSDKLFKGELVYQMFHVKQSQTKEQANLEAYAQKTADRLAAGKRPDVRLTGAGWDAVIENGDWEGEKEEPLPIDTKRNSGTVVFKRKRSLSDKLALAAIERRPGCRAALAMAVIVLAVLVMVLVWKCAA
jgi:hypothetical protein